MKTEFTRQRMNLMANYGRNALIQLIVACGVAFILLHAVNIIFVVFSPAPKTVFQNIVLPQVALQPFEAFITKPWTLITYAWGHSGFWNLLSNMLWLYCFGSVIQSLVGYREIIPLFVSTYIIGGCIYLGATIVWPGMPGSHMSLGALPSIMGFAVGALTLAPKFKYYLGERFSIPLWVVFGIFLVINTLNFVPNNAGMMVLCGAGALVGFAYIKLLQSGRKPGAWFYDRGNAIQSWFSPDEINPERYQKRRNQTFKSLQEKGHISDESVDMLLDKINQKGYDSLTNEEKELLMKASKEQ